MLNARGVHVPEDVAARLRANTDLDELDRWLPQAVTVETADALFDT